MATSVTSTGTATKVGRGPSWPRRSGSNGNGHSNGHGKGGGEQARFSKDTYRIAVWIMIAAIVMMFAALTSGYIVLSGGSEWRPVRMPGVFIFSTGAILASSATMHHAGKLLEREDFVGQSRWLVVTLLLGLVFLGAQLFGWRQLIAQGAFLSGNPHSSFFYLFTGAHGIHLVGGLTALSYLAVRSRRRLVGVDRERRIAATEAVSLYWHFMDGLWLCLFLLLLLWK